MIRPIQSPEETITRNASLRGRLRITGGDGEGEPKPVPAEVIIKTEEPKSESDSDSGDDKIRDYESKLDKEKADRIKLQAKLDEAQAKLNEKLAGDQTEAQQTAAERDQLKEKYEKLKEFMETGYLDTAILKEKKYDWHDVEAVRAFIDKNNIRMDMDTGKIEGLDIELKRIAKEKPYLLVNKTDQPAPNTPPPAAGTPSSGSHPFGGSARQRETDRAKIAAKYRIGGFSGGVTSRPM